MARTPIEKLTKAIDEIDSVVVGLQDGSLKDKKAAKALDKPLKRILSAQRLLNPQVEEEE